MPPQTQHPKRFWEDFLSGQVIEYGPRFVTREEIVAFGKEFDPQPFHLSEDAARGTMLGELCASGWHSCCILMRMMADGFVLNSSSMGAPGIDEVKWLKPIRPGDELTLRAIVLATRASNSRPNMGFVTALLELTNARGEKVMTLTAPLMFGRRTPGGAGA